VWAIDVVEVTRVARREDAIDTSSRARDSHIGKELPDENECQQLYQARRRRVGFEKISFMNTTVCSFERDCSHNSGDINIGSIGYQLLFYSDL
jgi:hypothetical protein